MEKRNRLPEQRICGKGLWFKAQGSAAEVPGEAHVLPVFCIGPDSHGVEKGVERRRTDSDILTGYTFSQRHDLVVFLRIGFQLTVPQIEDGFDAGNVALHFERVQRGV